MAKGILLGDKFPDFKAETNEGTIESFHDWIGKEYALHLLSNYLYILAVLKRFSERRLGRSLV